MLVGSIFLIRTRRIAVECEKGPRGISNGEPVLLQMLYHVGSAKIPGYACVNPDIHYLARCHLIASGMSGQDLFNNSHPHKK